MSKIIAAVNQKGGVGKTTLVLNLAFQLSLLGKKVLIVDNDPQAHASSVLLPDTDDDTTPYINDIYLRADPATKLILHNPVFKVAFLAANIFLADAEMQLISKFGRETHLKRALASLKYDYIFIDCGPSLGMLTVNALTAADNYIVATRPERFALAGIKLVQETVKLIKEELNPDLALLGVCITWMPHTNIAKQHRQSLVDTFKEKMFQAEISQNKDVEEAQTNRVPVSKWNPSCKAAQQYAELVKEVLAR
jgi:chromosome partitioning protein